MSLDAVRTKNDFVANTVNESKTVFEKWENFPVSVISHHGTACCEIAREWLFAMDFSKLNAGSLITGPRWIRQRYSWGPTRWQIHWCEAIHKKTLDCGALAAFAHAVFEMRGVKSFRVQLVQQFSLEATAQWLKKWNAEETSVHWINNDSIYHEGCAVLVKDNEIKLWDASAGWWIDPKQCSGYGALLALRVIDNDFEKPEFFKWGTHCIVPNQWQRIGLINEFPQYVE